MRRCGFPVFLKEGGRNKSYCQGNPKRHEHDSIQIAEEWNEIGYQVDGTECIRCHARRDDFGIPRHPRLTGSEVQGDDIPFQDARPLAEPMKEGQMRVLI